MMRTSFLPLLVVAFFLIVPVVTHAQACTPDNPNSCKAGSVCKDIGGGGQYFCVANDGTTCAQACKSNEVCAEGTCRPVSPVTPTAPADSGPGGGIDSGAGGGVDSGAGGGMDSGPGGSGGGAQTLQNPLKFKTLPELLDAILQAIVELGAIVLTVMLIWVGFLFVSAQGNPEKVSTARSALLWTIIGGLILLGAEAISKVVEATVTSLQ